MLHFKSFKLKGPPHLDLLKGLYQAHLPLFPERTLLWLNSLIPKYRAHFFHIWTHPHPHPPYPTIRGNSEEAGLRLAYVEYWVRPVTRLSLGVGMETRTSCWRQSERPRIKTKIKSKSTGKHILRLERASPNTNAKVGGSNEGRVSELGQNRQK